MQRKDILELSSSDDHEGLEFLKNQANSSSDRFENGGKLQDLDESVGSFRSALGLCPEDHPLRPVLLNHLATSLLTRFKQEGNKTDLDDAISMYREALALRPEGHPDRSKFLNNLANSLVKRFDQCSLVEDLDDVIKLHRAIPNFRHLHSSKLKNFVYSLLVCFERGAGSNDLNDAIELYRAALALHPGGHPDRSTSLNNLGYSLVKRFEDGGSEDNLDESISLLRCALALRPKDHPDHYVSLTNLANSLLTRFEQGGNAEDVQDSVDFLSARYQQNGNEDDLNESISLFRAAIALREGERPDSADARLGLASSLHARFRKEGCEKDSEEAIQLLRGVATRALSGSLVRLEAAQRWVGIARPRNHHSTLDAYKTAISILQHSLTVRSSLSLQHEFIRKASNGQKLPLDAASFALEKGDLGQAIELLEQGRGILWSQMRGLRVPLDRLSAENKTLADRFKDVSSRLEALMTNRDSFSREVGTTGDMSGATDKSLHSRMVDERLTRVRSLSEEQNEIIHGIRRIPGFENFLQAPSFSTLQKAASEGPVIVINHSSFRCDALIVLPRTDIPCVCVPLDEKWYEDALELCNELIVVRQIFQEQSDEYDETLQRVMKELWDRVVSKVVPKLRELGISEGSRIWWCPTSYLFSLPFHAAGPYRDANGKMKYLLDDYISSYTPTLTSLISARSGIRNSIPRLLVIRDSKLSFARAEYAAIQRRIRAEKCLADENASCSSVTNALENSEWVHFICHGRIGSDPFKSSFALHGGPLTLLDIASARLPNAELAYLSACNTAGQSPSFALDEALHLAAAIQFCGFRSVIGTMWKFLDKDGPILAEKVYLHLMQDIPEGEARFKRSAAAVREAALYRRNRKDVDDDWQGVPVKTERWVNLIHIGA